MHGPHAVILLVIVAGLYAGEVALAPASGFTADGDGFALAKGQEGHLRSATPLPPGLWLVRGEYRSSGIAADGLIGLDVQAVGRKASLSPYASTPAAADWAPFALPVKAERAEVVSLRLGNWRGAADGARVQVRQAVIVPYEFAAPNLLVNGDFGSGRPGEQPAMWEWRGKQYEPGCVALAENSSFRTGRHVLRLTGGAESRVLAYPNLPMPPRGEIEFSAWARSTGGARTLNLWLFGEGWKPRVTCGGEVSGDWRRFSGILAANPEQASYGVRLDLPAGAGAVELADVRVVWHPDGRKDAGGQAELTRGWQGVPGRNLVLNPDFELDGVGWTYDTSWAKQLAQFRGTQATRPVAIADGGMDGGRCAAFTGPGQIRTDMFPVKVGATYSISAHLRAPPGVAAGDCTVALIDSEWGHLLVKKVDGITADAWKRHEWTVTWSKPNRLGKAYVRFNSANGLLLDRVQVEEGQPTAYAAPVMLGLLRAGPNYIVRGRDQPGFSVRTVLDGKGPVELLAVARDAWGAESWRLERRVEAGGDLPVEVPTDRLGHFHVELTAKRGGNVVGIGTARYAILDPPRLEEVTPGRFGLLGVCHELFNYPLWWNQAVGPVMRDLGIRTTRFFARTPADLPDPLPDDVAAGFRAALRSMSEVGIAALPCIDLFAPAHESEGSLAMPTPAQLSGQRQGMERWVRALQPELRAVELFNEPDLRRVSSGPDAGKRTLPPAKYVLFQQAGFEAIRAVDPGITVVACGLNTARWEWLEEWAKAGGGKWMDQLSWHGYGSWGIQIPAEAERIRAIFAKAGFTGPIIDSEMYFAWRDFSQRTGTEEYFRGYFSDRELDAAGRSIQFWIGHAAAGVPYCAFAPFITILNHGPGNQVRTWDLFAALNAASRFLIGAGRGEVVETGLPYSAILFAQATEGPLLAVWAGSDVQGSLLLPGTWTAFDIMGNAYSPAQRTAGVRLASDPAWIRFPAGTTPAAVRAALAAATALGLGSPIALSVGLGGPDRVTAFLTSRSNKPLDGRLRILAAPEGWSATAGEIPFTGLEPGRTRAIAIPFSAMSAKDLGSYPLSVIAESGDDFARAQTVIRPLFVRNAVRVTIDADIAEWPADGWIALGEDRLSKAFTEGLAHTGPADLAARLACAWIPDGLALAVVVRDDVHAPAESERLGWQGDALQLYLDQLGDADRSTPRDDDDIAYTIGLMAGRPTAWIDKGSEGHFKGEANKRDGFVDADPRVAVMRRGQDTVYEILLPWSSCLPRVKPGAGAAFGLSLLVNDNDGKGRKPGLTLATPGGEPYGAPWDWLDAVLMP